MRRPLLVAAAAALAGVLLLGGAVTQAKWGGTQLGQATVITSGGITGTVTAPTIGYPVTGSVPTNTVVRTGSQGMIPGQSAQTFTYTVTNTSVVTGATAPSSLRAEITLVFASTVTSSVAYAAALPYLSVTSTVTKGATALGATTTGCVTAAGIACSPPLSARVSLLPGESATVLVTFALAATGLSPLYPYRSSTTSVAGMFDFAPTVNLTQLPRTQS